VTEGARLAGIRDQVAAITPGDWAGVHDVEGAFEVGLHRD
jgi:hypothetical protein